MTTLRIEPINAPAKRCGEYSLIDARGREVGIITGKALARKLAAVDDLLAAVRALLPRGWRDGTMDHMPGVKVARLALAKAMGRRT